jgi:hypothetical protein
MFPRGGIDLSVHRKDGGWIVRWRAYGRNRSRAFRTRRDAERFDRDRRRDSWRDSVAPAEGTVSAATADRRNTFIVVERMPTMAGVVDREIHEGYFTNVRQADRYRQSMPDADDLAIVLLRQRFRSRELTAGEIVAGKVDESLADPVRLALALAGKADRELPLMSLPRKTSR